MKSILVALALLLSGCLMLTPPAEPLAGFTDAQLAASFEQATALRLDLDDFEGNAVALEIVTAPDAPVSVTMQYDLASDEGSIDRPATPQVCMSTFTAGYRSQLIGSLRAPGVMVSAGGIETGVRQQALGSIVDSQASFEVESWDHGLSTPMVIGLAGAQEWRSAGATMDIELHSSQPFWFRVREAGDIECRLLAAEGDGGNTIDVGTAVVVRDEEFPFSVDGSNVVGLYIASDGGHVAQLLGGDTRMDVVHNDVGDFASYWGSGRLPAGPYTWRIDEMQGTNTLVAARTMSALIIQDVEDWAMVDPWESGPETGNGAWVHAHTGRSPSATDPMV